MRRAGVEHREEREEVKWAGKSYKSRTRCESGVAVLLFVYDKERMVGWMDGTDGRREERMDGRKDRWKVFHQ